MAALPEEQQRKLQLAVAKAAFSTTLIVPGEPKVPAQLVAALQSLLTSVTSETSQCDVKDVRIWIMENCKLAKQVTALVRYMSAFCATLSTFKARLVLLYVLNDVFLHAATTETTSNIAPSTVSFLPAIVQSVQSAPDAQVEPVNALFKVWAEKSYFGDEEYTKITGQLPTMMKDEVLPTEPERKTLVKPASLGTKGDPHWLLPVSCMLETMDYPNNYKPIAAANVKAINLSATTDPSLLELVESFESTIHEWKFREEEGSEGDEFDGEGWNMKFWMNRDEKERFRNQERIRLRALEKIGRMGIGKVSEKAQSPSSGRGSARQSGSWNSESRSRSPRRKESSSSPPRRKHSYSRSSSRSRSPEPRRERSPGKYGRREDSPSPPRRSAGRGAPVQDGALRNPPYPVVPPAQQYPSYQQSLPWQSQQQYPSGPRTYAASPQQAEHAPGYPGQHGEVHPARTHGQAGQQFPDPSRYPSRGGYGRQSDGSRSR